MAAWKKAAAPAKAWRALHPEAPARQHRNVRHSAVFLAERACVYAHAAAADAWRAAWAHGREARAAFHRTLTILFHQATYLRQRSWRIVSLACPILTI